MKKMQYKKVISILLILAMLISVIPYGITSITAFAADYTSDNAYFHDQGGIYMTPLEPTANDKVTIRFRAPKDKAQSVQIYTTDIYGTALNNYTMSKTTAVGNSEFDYYEYVLPATSQRYRYYFRMKVSGFSYKYYSTLGVSASKPSNAQFYFSVWPNFKTPDWSKGAYWYSLVPTAFYNGNTLNDIGGEVADLVSSNQGGLYHAAFYGGDIAGVSQKLSYIEDLGCTGIYMNPLWPSLSSVGYGIHDTYMIDPQFGTEEELASLIDQIHNSDMRFMMDVVIHSVLDKNMWFNTYRKYPTVGAYQSQSSPYYDLFHFNSWPNDPTKFFASFVLDYKNELTRKLIFKDSDSYLKRYLAEPYNVDAYRFDAGAHLYGTNMSLNEVTQMITSELKSVYPNKLLVCENYTDDSNSYDHLNNGWDTTWNTPMLFALRNFAQRAMTPSKLKENSAAHIRSWPRSMGLSMYVPITTHDTARLQNTADDAGMRAARLFQMTYLGSPSLYYGDETDAYDSYASSTVPFDWNENNWNMDTYSFVKTLGQLRNEYTALKTGVVKYGDVDNNKGFMSYARWDDEGTVVTLLNTSKNTQTMTVDVKQFEVFDGETLTDYFTGQKYTVIDGMVTVDVVSGGTLLVSGDANVEYMSNIGKNNTTTANGDYCDDFTGGLNSTDFAVSGNYTVVNDAFKTNSKKTTYLTLAPKNDWTLKTSFTANLNANQYAGIAATGENNDAVFAGRLNQNGKQEIILARISNGIITIYDSVQDTRPDAELTIQLQRTGNYFTASYKYNDEYIWNTFDGRIFGSYFSEKIGLYSIGKAEFDYVTLGNKIDGGESLCTPINKNSDVNVDFADGKASMTMVSWTMNGGAWDYTVGGLSKTDNTQGYFVASNVFEDFRSEVTVSAPEGSNKTGIVFGAETIPTTSKGYYLALNNSGVLTLYKDGNTVLATANVALDQNSRVKLILERVKDRIVVYAGLDMTPAINVVDSTYRSGKFAFTSSGAAYFGNYSVFSTDDIWTEISDTYINGGRISYASDSVTLKGSSGIDVALSRKGVGYTEFYAGAKLSVNGNSDLVSGIALMGREGVSPFNKGVVVGVNNRGVVILKDGVVVKEKACSLSYNNITLAVSYKNGVLNVFVNNILTPVISCEIPFNGGTVSLVSRSADTIFSDFSVEDITNIDVNNSLAFYETALSSQIINFLSGATVTTNANYITVTGSGYSKNISNTSISLATEYVQFTNGCEAKGQTTEIKGTLLKGSTSVSGNNKIYNSPVITFRKVKSGSEEGYLKIRMMQGGGMYLVYGTDFVSGGSHFELFTYDNGTYNRNDSIDNEFRIISDSKTVSMWLNGVLVINNYNYSSSFEDVSPAAAVGFHQCYSTISEFTHNTVIGNIVVLSDSVDLSVSNTNAQTGEKVTVTKTSSVESGSFNAIYRFGNEINGITLSRDGFRKDESSVNKYSFLMPEFQTPVIITAVSNSINESSIEILGAQYKIENGVASIRFGTRFVYDVVNNKFTVNGAQYTLKDSGTLITSITALNKINGSPEELMQIDAYSLWGEKAYNLVNVKRTKYYDYCNEYIDFTAVLTNIPESKFDKVYAARGYVVGVDTNGNCKTFYTDIMYRSVNDLK